jgi:hypothetical protein
MPWYTLVSEYSKQTLTKPDDKLPAISGLAALFHAQQNIQLPKVKKECKYVAELWLKDISCRLALSVKTERHSGGAATEVNKFDPLKGFRNYCAPSFS